MSIIQDYILIIINCKKFNTKALYQKATWLKQIPGFLKYYHIIGEPTLENDYLFDNSSNILFVKTQDDYNSLPKKVIAAHKAICDTFKFKYLFKTDDDQILVNSIFFKRLTSILYKSLMNKPIHYGGFVVNIKKQGSSKNSEYYMKHNELPKNLILSKTKYCSGRFYFLSKPAIFNLQSKREKVEQEFLEDYAIGCHLDSYFKKNMVHIATNHYFTDIENSDFSELNMRA